MGSLNSASNGAGEQAFLSRLRQETASCHAALEAHPLSQSITSAAINKTSYAQYLRAMQQVVNGLEEELHEILMPVISDLQQRSKQAWIGEDVAHLDCLPADDKPFRFPQGNQSIPFALGAYYVLEGSTLGGRVILKSLPESLAFADGKGTRYFSGYGTETGLYWKSFINTLCSYAVKNNCEEEVIAGAKSAFAGILEYFNYYEVHEAARHCQS
jgi:heme oxygenase